jgi:hypothetical protein
VVPQQVPEQQLRFDLWGVRQPRHGLVPQSTSKGGRTSQIPPLRPLSAFFGSFTCVRIRYAVWRSMPAFMAASLMTPQLFFNFLKSLRYYCSAIIKGQRKTPNFTASAAGDELTRAFIRRRVL